MKPKQLHTYDNKTLELEELVRRVPKVLINPLEHQTTEIPSAVKIHFVDAVFMPLFEDFADFACRTLKLVNFKRAAINLSFYERHKYKLTKEPNRDEIKNTLQERLLELKEFITQGDLFTEAAMIQEKRLKRQELLALQEILNDFEFYDFATSNYYRNYTYWYVSWRWALEDGSLDFASEHLLKDETDRKGKVTIQKENVIFVDRQKMAEHTPQQNKMIEDFLKSFPTRLDNGNHDIFIKPKDLPH